MLGVPQFVCDVVTQGYKVTLCHNARVQGLPESKVSGKSAITTADFVLKAIAELCKDNLARKVVNRPVVISPLLVVINRSGKERLVINLLMT